MSHPTFTTRDAQLLFLAERLARTLQLCLRNLMNKCTIKLTKYSHPDQCPVGEKTPCVRQDICVKPVSHLLC